MSNPDADVISDSLTRNKLNTEIKLSIRDFSNSPYRAYTK